MLLLLSLAALTTRELFWLLSPQRLMRRRSRFLLEVSLLAHVRRMLVWRLLLLSLRILIPTLVLTLFLWRLVMSILFTEYWNNSSSQKGLWRYQILVYRFI